VQIARSSLEALCRKYGPQLVGLPDGVDGAQLLWALAGNESSFGAESNPRHEPGYCRGGRYFNPNLTATWGCLAHMSYGPWQVMFTNALNQTPLALLQSYDLCAVVTTVFLKSYVLLGKKPKNLAEIGEVYNEGHIAPDPDYVAKLDKNYAIALGELA
jgi:hypothetical protein